MSCFWLTDVDSDAKTGAQSQRMKLCQISSDLKRFPRSVVTFVLTEEASVGRSLAAESSAPPPKSHLLAKRHYTAIGENSFGHAGHPMIEFDQEEERVTLRFLGAKGAKVFQYEDTREALSDHKLSHAK